MAIQDTEQNINQIKEWKDEMKRALSSIGIDVSGLKLSEWAKKITDTEVSLPQ